jgi:hypothetical protein
MALKTARKRSNPGKRKGTPRTLKPILQAQAKRRAKRPRPGVKKPASKMTPAEMLRKGSWATRFYGRKRLPRLVDAQGRPTRFALTAPDWGEPVPRTVAAARRIAAKGRTLLQRYQRSKLR